MITKIYFVSLTLLSIATIFCGENKQKKLNLESLCLSSSQKIVPIQTQGDWQKTAVKSGYKNELFLLSMPITGPDNYSSVNQFYASKNIQTCDTLNLEIKPVSSRFYNVKEELYREKKDVYAGEPFYNPGGENVHKSKGNWLKRHELTNCLDVFPNNTLVMTHAWGGIELIHKESVVPFIVNNSISSVCCLPNNKHIAIGSYDGNITILDIEKTNLEPKTKFKNYYGKKHKQALSPLAIASLQLDINYPITSLQHCPNSNSIFFSSDSNLYATQIPTTQEKMTLKPKLISTAWEPISCFDLSNNYIAYVSEQNKITVINLENSQHVFAQHDCPITSICFTTINNCSCIVTGDTQGNIIFWDISDDNIAIRANIAHEGLSIQSIEVTKDSEYIAVKTTEEIKKELGYVEKKDTVLLYSTPDALPKHRQMQDDMLNSIVTMVKSNNDNPQKLYDILSQHKDFLYHQESNDIVELRKSIQNRIIEILTHNDFIKSIDSIEKLNTLFCSFSCTDFRIPTTITLSGMNVPKNREPLKNIDLQITKTLKDIAVPFLSNELDKNLSWEDQKNIYTFSFNLFWGYFHNVRHGHNKLEELPPAIGNLVDKLMVIHDIVQPNKYDSLSYYKARASYFVTNNAPSVIATVVALPLAAWYAYKYFTGPE